MDVLSLIPDNLSELLVKVLQFTDQRRDILYRNIHSVRMPDFVPHDMPVLEFADALNSALAEHIRNHRLLFCDTENIKFGPKTKMQIAPVVDHHANALLQKDRDEYLECQINKLLENSLNRKVAAELLRFNQGLDDSTHLFGFEETIVNTCLPDDASTHNDKMD